MQQLRLEVLDAPFRRLLLGEIAHKAGKKPPAAGIELAYFEFHGEGRAILAQTDDDTTDADDAPLARFHITSDITVMRLVIWRRHQHVDIPSDDLRFAVAEQALRGVA